MTWNVAGRMNKATIDGQRKYIESRAPDVVALQEVSRKQVEYFADLLSWSCNSFEIADERPCWPTARHNLGCLIAGADPVRPVAPASRLPSLYEGPFPAPERTLATPVASPLGEILVASLYQVTGDARSSGWGPLAKRETFRQWAAWLATRTTATIVGLDANSPRIDHPDITRNEYWDDRALGSQDEWLLHDPARASHCLRDAYRLFVDRQPGLLAELRRLRPNGPLAISHVNRSRVTAERRYDFVYLTPDLVPEHVEYLTEISEPSDGGRRLSDHAPVVAEISLA